MEYLAEIIRGLPSEYRTIVIVAFVTVPLTLTVYAALHSARNEQLPLGASSNLLRSVMLWVACLPPIILALLLLLTFGIELWKELTHAVQSAPN